MGRLHYNHINIYYTMRTQICMRFGQIRPRYGLHAANMKSNTQNKGRIIVYTLIATKITFPAYVSKQSVQQKYTHDKRRKQ
jgi:hypothetical protein